MIELFPDRMLDSSIHTAILIGLLTQWVCTETLGWVFAGYVVVGYLAAIVTVAPMSAVAIVWESVLTFLLTWALGEALPRLGIGQRVFGRHRFLLFLLASVPARLWVEALAAPGFEAWLGGHGMTGRFYGIGVVLVPLLANMYWKVGLARGMATVGVTTALTWAVLAQGLLRLTNLHLMGFDATFEGIATDFLAVPKVYIVLLATAAVAARHNLRYGWDFGGILVPALIAVTAFSPTKVLTTAGEVVVLVTVYRALLRMPGVRALDLDGPRRLVSMYVVSYALKWTLAWLATLSGLPFYVSDLFGFGYLLTSLIALKCLKGGTVHTLAVLHGTALQGLLLGLALSLGLHTWQPEAPDEPPPDEGPPSDRWWLAVGQVRAQLPVGAEPTPSPPVPPPSTAPFSVDACLRAAPTARSLVSVWACPGDGPVLIAPQPLADPDSLWVVAWLTEQVRPSRLVMAAVDPEAPAGTAMAPSLAQALHAAAGGIDGTPRWVVRTHEGGTTFIDPAGTDAWAHVGRLPAAPRVRFADDHGGLEPLWTLLEPQDLVLEVARDEVRHRLPEPRVLDGLGPLVDATPSGPPEGRSPRRPSPLDVRGLARTLWPLLRPGVPPALPERREVAWVAAALGLRATYVQPEGGWWLQTTDTSLPIGDWAFLDGTGPHVDLPAAAAEPGVASWGHRLARRLDAPTIHVGGRTHDDDVDSFLWMQRTQDTPSGVVAVRRQASPPPGAPLLVRSGPVGAEPAALAQALLPWGDAAPADGGRTVASFSSAGWPVARRLARMGVPHHALWVHPDLLGESPGSPEALARLQAYGDLGVPVVLEPGEGPLGQPPGPAWHGPLPPGAAALRTHAERLDLASLAQARGLGAVTVHLTPERMVLAWRDGAYLCTATRGQSADGWPWRGCWSLR